MPNILPRQFERIFPFASKSCRELNNIPKANHTAEHSGESSKLERNSGHAPLRTPRPKKEVTARFFVRITDVRKRLIDPDNLCEKFHLDLCRYAGILPGDSAKEIELETRQRKILKGEEPHTEILIHEIS